MNNEEELTIEKLSKNYKDKSQFDLVIYAIKLAVEMIKSGREPRIKLKCQNKASQILSEMLAGKDSLENITLPVKNTEKSAEI